MGIVVATSGGFDPIHKGHLQNLKEAKKLGYHEVYLASDAWLIRKKGYCLLPYETRKEILESLSFVDEVRPQIEDPSDSSVASLMLYVPNIFAKGGDRTPETMPEYEIIACEKLGIEIKYGVGGYDKPESSSDLFLDAVNQYMRTNGLFFMKYGTAQQSYYELIKLEPTHDHGFPGTVDFWNGKE